ncbi:hypothetical protein O3P69_008310 [Scylla paramamosain]|uniref:Uncharacterized protein n=1 Tax=Scylla paramamosain TaxID=85552 RepID=A0AAW0SKR7_SCYPA
MNATAATSVGLAPKKAVTFAPRYREATRNGGSEMRIKAQTSPPIPPPPPLYQVRPSLPHPSRQSICPTSDQVGSPCTSAPSPCPSLLLVRMRVRVRMEVCPTTPPPPETAAAAAGTVVVVRTGWEAGGSPGHPPARRLSRQQEGAAPASGRCTTLPGGVEAVRAGSRGAGGRGRHTHSEARAVLGAASHERTVADHHLLGGHGGPHRLAPRALAG